MIIQNIAHSTGSTDVTFTVPRRRARPRARRAEQGARRDRLRRDRPRHARRQDLDRRGGHAQPRGRGGDDVQDIGRPRHQHPGDHDERDQGQRADPRGTRPSWPSACSIPLMVSMRRTRRPEAPGGGRGEAFATRFRPTIARKAVLIGPVTRGYLASSGPESMTFPTPSMPDGRAPGRSPLAVLAARRRAGARAVRRGADPAHAARAGARPLAEGWEAPRRW